MTMYIKFWKIIEKSKGDGSVGLVFSIVISSLQQNWFYIISISESRVELAISGLGGARSNH